VHDVVIALALGFAGGVASGLLGIGGGALFVPGLVVFLDLAQVRSAAVLGTLALPGVLLGAALANVVPERALAIGFACVQVVFAIGLARRALGLDGGS
jgi:uncharacterized membrane protein YfcA